MKRALLFLLLGCETEGVIVAPEASLERMKDQPKLDAYEPSDLFDDGRGMRYPPPGTVPYSREPFDPRIELGRENGRDVEEIPLDVDLALVERGRDRYTIFCSVCHGLEGDGKSPIARELELVRPPSLVDDRIRSFTAGRMFRVSREGFGVMPSYRAQLSTRDHWAVVAYVQALQLRARVPLDQLPPELRSEANEALP